MSRFLAAFVAIVLMTSGAQAFCGFYVARADGKLFNEASKVVFVRHKKRSVITMASDYRGAAKDFAMIVPTPTVLRRDQIKTVKPATIDHLDAYSAPRLVGYHDPDPCNPAVYAEPVIVEEAADCRLCKQTAPARRQGARALGVKVQARYAVGAYDIVMLSAQQSDGLTTWLTQEGYQLPEGAAPVLGKYIKQGMKFFVARVNLARHKAGESQDLKPLQIRFISDKFMLPLQLGKLNADQKQDVLIMTLTKSGRVEAANYRNARIPTDTNIPTFVRDVFGQFYRDSFARAAKKNTVLTEYAWDMGWCDPCAADPLSRKELTELGINWLWDASKKGPIQDVFVTRLHFQYDKKSFAKDLELKVTTDNANFQGRYVMNTPFEGDLSCKDGKSYLADLKKRLRREGATLRKLTGWPKGEIDQRIRQSLPDGYY